LKEKNWFKEVLNHFETYIGTGIFLFLTAILTVQVISRYVLGISFAWIEEVSIILLVMMVYCGVSGAVLSRQFLKIDMVLTMVPFRVKRVMLIVSTIIHAAFTGWLTYYFSRIISTMVKFNSVYSITRVPKLYVYVIVAFFLTLSILRAVQEVIKLSRENEQQLGRAIPAFDLEVIWQEGVQARDAYFKEHPEAAKEGKKK